MGREIASRVMVEVTAKDVIIDSAGETAVADSVVEAEGEADVEVELLPHCLCLCIRVLVLSAVKVDTVEEISDALLVESIAARVGFGVTLDDTESEDGSLLLSLERTATSGPGKSYLASLKAFTRIPGNIVWFSYASLTH